MDGYPSKYTIIILIALIVLSMMFSISESSILGMNKLKLRIKRKNKDKKAVRISKLLEHREQLINTLLVSNDLVNIFVSSIIAEIALGIFGSKGVGIATLVATVLLLIFGEITPKTISTRCPDTIAYGLSGFVKLVYILMYPIVKIVTFISKIILRCMGIKLNNKKQSYTEEEIKTFFDISSESGAIEEDETRMMTQVFKFSDLEAEEIMVPRTKIRALSSEASYSDVIEASERTGFTRFPVYKNSIDDIIGIIYLKDVLPFKENPDSFELHKVMRPPLFILGTKKMSSIQQMFFENRQTMAVVVDEYSGTDGIITEKDISREIFALPGDSTLRGKVFDYDSVENKDEFEINGSVLIRDLQLSLHIPMESKINETVAGWFIERINRMPENGDRFEYEGYVFTVEKIQAHRIERLSIKKNSEEEEESLSS
ncbi:MAG: CNNM domain-containing protein [Treponema sp.]|nr:CNNM domain-containing protein [Treponema sp.]